MWANIRAAAGPATALVIIAFFGGYALFGANGMLAWGDYSKQLRTRQGDLASVERARDQLAHRVALLDPRHADPDLADELVRRDLGVAQPDEIIVPLR